MLTSIRAILASTLVVGTLIAATPALADETDPPPAIKLSGSVAVVSNYKYRGLAQSDNKPTVQGSITVSHESGLYLSVWGSGTNGNFFAAPIAPGGSEIDVYGGYTKDLGVATIDVGAYGYLYPNAPAGNYYEFYGSVAKTVGPVTAKVGVNYTPAQKVFDYNFTSPTRHNTYVYGDLSGGIPGTPVTLHGHLGHTGGGFDYSKQYLDYSVGASIKWNALTLDASLVGTDVSKTDIDAGFGCGSGASCINFFNRMSKTVGVVSLTAAF